MPTNATYQAKIVASRIMKPRYNKKNNVPGKIFSWDRPLRRTLRLLFHL